MAEGFSSELISNEKPHVDQESVELHSIGSEASTLPAGDGVSDKISTTIKKSDHMNNLPKIVKERVVSFSKNIDNVCIFTGDKSIEADDKSDVPILENNLILASTLVVDAKNGRHSDFEMNDKSVRMYIIYHHSGLRYLLYFFILLHHFVAVFEKPAFKSWELPYWVTMALELACLSFYVFRLLHLASFLPLDKFWRDKKNLLILSAILLTGIDMICYAVLVNAGHSDISVRWSRPLRPIFIINFSENKQVRRAFRNIRRTLPDILNVLILFFLSIGLFSLMAQKLFKKRNLTFPDGSPYFTNYLDTFFDLYVLVTTANNPDIMMPAYDENHFSAFFFLAYLVICLYIFMNIFLAVIYNNYRKHLKNEVKKVVYMKRQSLSRAFDILKIKIANKCALDYKRFNALLKTIPPKRSPMLVNILWFVLDSDNDNLIGKADFLHLADLLNVAVSEVKDRKTIFDKVMPKFYHSKASKLFRTAVSHKYFRYLFDIFILLNAGLIAADINEAEWCFLALFMFEIISKIYTFGIKEFFRKLWNIFDFVVIGAAVVATAVETAIGDTGDDKSRTLDILLVLRVLRLVKIVGGINRFQVIVVTIMNLGPSILTYGGVLCVMFYTFAIIGMEVFQNKITYHGYNETDPSEMFCGNPKLNGSAFYNSRYCSNNFNNIFNAMVILFELMVVNQWHILTSGFVIVTSKAARIYFFLFHLTCVIIVLNIFTAFVLEAFILEYSFSKSKLESAIETKIEEMGLRLGRKQTHVQNETDKDTLVSNADLDLQLDSDHDYQDDEVDSRERAPSNLPDLSHETEIRFRISKNKNVENLLQKMFENELDVEDIGPEDIDDMDISADIQKIIF
ncbi:two pore calcium channel protein 1-like isoform X2 [Centruroides sculpturatus]|uniref:two pore calcium channel protein 1-like isoform X2 n=2 Tax=Centruroides sculpturatus TaxID=218467 RepID=UPI000C6D268B|nr:two pore calcium channel protein 1-like isoform X2 [Centruroides sculpturatus]